MCVQAPDCSVVGVGEKVLLFRHQASTEQLLQRLSEHDELQDGDLIEVIIAGQMSDVDVFVICERETLTHCPPTVISYVVYLYVKDLTL